MCVCVCVCACAHAWWLQLISYKHRTEYLYKYYSEIDFDVEVHQLAALLIFTKHTDANCQTASCSYVYVSQLYSMTAPRMIWKNDERKWSVQRHHMTVVLLWFLSCLWTRAVHVQKYWSNCVGPLKIIGFSGNLLLKTHSFCILGWHRLAQRQCV